MGPVVSFLLHFMVLTLLGLSHRQTQDNPDLLDNIDWSQAPWHPPSSPEVSSSLRWCLQWPLHDVSTDSCRPDRSLAGSWTLRWTSGQRKLLSFPVPGTFVLELLFLLYSLGTRTLTALPVSLLSYHQGAVRSVILPPAALPFSLSIADGQCVLPPPLSYITPRLGKNFLVDWPIDYLVFA